MDLYDLFDRKNHRRKPYRSKHDDYRGHDDGREHGYDDRYYGHTDRHALLDRSRLVSHLLANKKLFILAGVVILAVIVLAAIIVLPLLGQVVDYIDKIGLKGVIDRLWQGTAGSK